MMERETTSSDARQRIVAALTSSSALDRRLEDFTPMDNIPWEQQAEQLLRCAVGDGFFGLRSPEQVDREVEALLDHFELARGAAILDLGCGPGMYANRLGARDYRVTGLDIAQPLLDYAETQAQALGLSNRYMRGSLFDLDLPAVFDAAFLANSIINQLDDIQLRELLAGVRRALLPGGHFLCEIVLEPAGFRDQGPIRTQTLYSLPRSPWSDEPHDWLERKLGFPAQAQRVVHHIIVPRGGLAREYWSRDLLHTREHVAAVFAASGFEVQAWFDRDLRSTLEPDRSEAWVLARA